MGAFKEILEEYDNLMQAGLDELAVGDTENAEEYFSDAAYVLNKVADPTLRSELENRYTINPLDFAK